MKKTYFSTMGMALFLGALPCWASSSPLEEVVQQRVLKATVTLKRLTVEPYDGSYDETLKDIL